MESQQRCFPRWEGPEGLGWGGNAELGRRLAVPLTQRKNKYIEEMPLPRHSPIVAVLNRRKIKRSWVAFRCHRGMRAPHQ